MTFQNKRRFVADIRNSPNVKPMDETEKFLAEPKPFYRRSALQFYYSLRIYFIYISKLRFVRLCCVRSVGLTLDTAMEHAMSSEVVVSRLIWRGFEAIKASITLFKCASLNSVLVPGFALIYDSKYHLKTSANVTKRLTGVSCTQDLPLVKCKLGPWKEQSMYSIL